MKILHVSKYYYPFIGGIEQTARDCVQALREEDAEQRVLCFDHEKGDRTDEVDGVRVVRAGCFAKISSQALSLHYKKLLNREMKDFEPDVVVFHFPNPFGAHYLLKALKKYPAAKLVVWWHLDITRQKILGKFFKGQTRRLLRRAEKIVATSPNYIEGSEFLPAFREKCVVVENCVAADRIAADPSSEEMAAKLRSEAESKTVLFALGRHVPYKGMEYLVRASKLLGGNYRIYIGGEGPLTGSLKELAAGDEKITFLGKVGETERKAYLLACDIFCFPSVTKNEAFGIALAEAMAFGRPSVTFTIEGSGVNYVSLNGETGIQVENGNVQAYADAIGRLASDEALRTRMGRAAQERAYALFTFEKFREKIISFIKPLA